MLYTVAQAQYGIIVMGTIPQYDLNALINVWSMQYDGKLRNHPEIAQKLGYTMALGTPEALETWAKELGMTEVEESEPEEATEDS